MLAVGGCRHPRLRPSCGPRPTGSAASPRRVSPLFNDVWGSGAGRSDLAISTTNRACWAQPSQHRRRDVVPQRAGPWAEPQPLHGVRALQRQRARSGAYIRRTTSGIQQRLRDHALDNMTGPVGHRLAQTSATVAATRGTCSVGSNGSNKVFSFGALHTARPRSTCWPCCVDPRPGAGSADVKLGQVQFGYDITSSSGD